MRSLEWGTDNSPEGFTQCFILTFADAAGRAAYLPRPAHVAFVEMLKPMLDDVLVLGYTL
ncbi:Dabb family protein [Acidovorax facilis]|uniref:Dabb family protein n=1 Tax=Acidovorax facilis TaxID=12917 RepID=UPI003CEA792C